MPNSSRYTILINGSAGTWVSNPVLLIRHRDSASVQPCTVFYQRGLHKLNCRVEMETTGKVTACPKKFQMNCYYLRLFTKVSFLYATTLRYFTVGCLYSPFLLTIFLLFNFSFREVGTTSASLVSSVCLGIIMSEFLLFVGFFWGAYTNILSASYITDSTITSTTEGLIAISSRGLIVTITFLLATASVIMGYGLLASEKCVTLNIQRGFTALVIIAVTFTSIQVCEYLGLTVSINDCALGTYLFILTGLHFLHVVVGAVLLFFTFWRGSLQYNSFGATINRAYSSSSIMVLPLLESYTLLYWHFVEGLWLLIHFTFYTL